MNPYFSQIRSSRKRQSEGIIMPALSYSVCGIYRVTWCESTFQTGCPPIISWCSQFPESSQTFRCTSFSFEISSGKLCVLPNWVGFSAAGFTLQMIPVKSVLLPVDVFEKKPDDLNVPRIITPRSWFAISSNMRVPTPSIVRVPIIVPPSLKSGVLKRMLVPSGNQAVQGPRSPLIRLFFPILPINSQQPKTRYEPLGPSSKQCVMGG